MHRAAAKKTLPFGNSTQLIYHLSSGYCQNYNSNNSNNNLTAATATTTKKQLTVAGGRQRAAGGGWQEAGGTGSHSNVASSVHNGQRRQPMPATVAGAFCCCCCQFGCLVSILLPVIHALLLLPACYMAEEVVVCVGVAGGCIERERENHYAHISGDLTAMCCSFLPITSSGACKILTFSIVIRCRLAGCVSGC